jgi:hypothetical protein
LRANDPGSGRDTELINTQADPTRYTFTNLRNFTDLPPPDTSGTWAKDAKGEYIYKK